MKNRLNLKYYNGTFDDIKNKQRNLWLGVSVSLKPYDENLAIQYLNFLSKYSKDKAIILIGDEIAAINYEILDKCSPNSSQYKAIKSGDIQQDYYKKIISKLPPEEQLKIQILRWEDIKTNNLENQIKILTQEYKQNPEFAIRIHKPIREYMKLRNKTITQQRLEKLSKYILSELPIILNGINHNNQKYSVVLYPTFDRKSSLDELACEIQNNNEFSHLKEKLNLQERHIIINAIIPKK